MHDDLLTRLRNYDGREFETTVCYNGLRDEAAYTIENMQRRLELVYGLLWHGQDIEARKVILAFFDRDAQARGIAAAKAHDKIKGELPKPIKDAVEELLNWSDFLGAHHDGEHATPIETVKIRAKALNLERWAEGCAVEKEP